MLIWGLVFVIPTQVKAEGINISAQILEQHVSNSVNKTINDFNYSNFTAQNSVPLPKKVAGTSTTNIRTNIFSRTLNKIVNFLSKYF
ncbi:MAG: hypothetical protein M1429_04330 [Patescibacteria group bacterium]|nr:hypothetical protein [Patescibacteria group bacterium]